MKKLLTLLSLLCLVGCGGYMMVFEHDLTTGKVTKVTKIPEKYIGKDAEARRIHQQ